MHEEGGTVRTKQEFGSIQLHIEWATPKEVSGSGQGRGNSGVFLQGTYELQVLDSYNNPTYADGQAGRDLRAEEAVGQRLPCTRRVADIRCDLSPPDLQGQDE